tara:strand:+ start:261 stop:848 length:588 start_codon:yes stop_codon:yes gene_type:complete
MLDFGTTSNSSNGTSSNVIVQPVTVADFNVTYGEKRDWQKYSDDIGIDLVLDVGQDFQPTMYIGGSFALDELNNTITGWGRAYKVKMLLDAIGLPVRLAKGTVVVDNRLPDDAKDHIVGKKFLRLSYLSTKRKTDGSHRWKDWQDTDKIGHEQALKDAFTLAVSKGYVKDFLDPDSADLDGPWEEENEVSAGMPL